jgi:hypothetical protein
VSNPAGAERSQERSEAPGDAYDRVRGARDDGDLAKQETRALRDKVRQLEAENAFLRQQLEALQGGWAARRAAPVTLHPPAPKAPSGVRHARER